MLSEGAAIVIVYLPLSGVFYVVSRWSHRCLPTFIRCILCRQEVEPTVGESLCRLFQPDENIDLRRIAQIARQSLKRHDANSGKSVSASASRSTSELSLPPPPGQSESSATSSRSDKLLLGLYEGRTLCRRRAWTSASSALGTLRSAACNWRTYFRDILGSLCCPECAVSSAAKTKLGGWRINVPITARDIDSEIPFRTLDWTFLLNPAGKSWCCMNCKWGGLVDRTLLHSLKDVLQAFL